MKKVNKACLAIFILLLSPSCSDKVIQNYKKTYHKIVNKTFLNSESDSKKYVFLENGTASWYGKKFNGRKTASGEIYDCNQLTAAHPNLPLPSMLRVTNIDNNKTTIVRVNDRGPYSSKRIVDLSEKAAIDLDFKDKGTAQVKIELIIDEND